MINRISLTRRPGAGTAYHAQALPSRAMPAGHTRSSLRPKHRIATKTWGRRLLLGMIILVSAYIAFSIHSVRVIHREAGGDNRWSVKETNSTFSQRPNMSHKLSNEKNSNVNDSLRASPDDEQESVTGDTEHSRQENNPLVAGSLRFDESAAEAALRQYGSRSIFRPITAYIEPPLNDTVPGTGSRGDLATETDQGTPPEFIIPLPLRTQTPEQLQKVVYDRVRTCRDMPGKFPVDQGLEFDAKGNVVVWNVADKETPDDFPQQELPHCPVESDPWLPWIHDVFPSQDGSRIEFVAQNKRRCRTGSKYTKEVNRLIPQVGLMQPISVERITEDLARQLAPELWHPTMVHSSQDSRQTPRYRLAPHNESSADGMFTRFICRFHATTFKVGMPPESVLLGETLSQYPFNYELVSYRKNKDAMLTPKGKDSILFWTSSVRFHCPVPDDQGLRQGIARGRFILSDSTPTVFVDLVPIRTSVRYNEHMLTEEQIGPRERWGVPGFNATERWGPRNVVPHFQASGRWENIPICLPPLLSKEPGNQVLLPEVFDASEKPHYLSACVWASAEFKTRGVSRSTGILSDTLERMLEWIEFHLLVGFDQIYLYDNSGAQTNQSSLKEVADRFPGKVTYIDWPSIICNNNIPAHDNTGERSSQYAAENSCRTRYGPFTEWIASFDSDEYLVPMGNYNSLKQVLQDAAKGGANILTFRSTRAKLRPDACQSAVEGTSLNKKPGVPFLEAYNCDPEGTPKPRWAERARKQIFRPAYVHYHFVHYSTVPNSILVTYAESQNRKSNEWSHRKHVESSSSERVVDELREALMVHTKSVKPDQTKDWRRHCHKDFEKKWLGCLVAVPWPNNTKAKGESAYDKDGLLYNCFINERVENYWVPRLKAALQERSLAAAINE